MRARRVCFARVVRACAGRGPAAIPLCCLGVKAQVIGLLKAIWLALTLRCDEAGRIAVAVRSGDATRGERVALRVHRLVCGACRVARRQLERLDEQLTALRDEQADAPGERAMPADMRARIAERMNEHGG